MVTHLYQRLKRGMIVFSLCALASFATIGLTGALLYSDSDKCISTPCAG